MKATKFFLILLAVVALFAFACKTEKAEIEEVVEQEELEPIDQWVADVTAVLNEWEPKAEQGETGMEDFIALSEQLVPLTEKAEELDLEANASPEQAEAIQAVNERMEALFEKMGAE